VSDPGLSLLEIREYGSTPPLPDLYSLLALSFCDALKSQLSYMLAETMPFLWVQGSLRSPKFRSETTHCRARGALLLICFISGINHALCKQPGLGGQFVGKPNLVLALAFNTGPSQPTHTRQPRALSTSYHRDIPPDQIYLSLDQCLWRFTVQQWSYHCASRHDPQH